MADYYHYWGKAENDQLKVAYCSGTDKKQILVNPDFRKQLAQKLKLPESQIGIAELDQWANTIDKAQGKQKWQISNNYAAYHLLPYHCLDVAAVARCWWDASPSLRQQFTHTMQLDNEQQARAWVLFFVALHDYGKFDVRFQRKASHAHKLVQPKFDKDLIDLSGYTIKQYAHGEAGLSLFYQYFQNVFDWYDEDNELWKKWKPYLSAVMGHHGSLPSAPNYAHLLQKDVDVDDSIIQNDLQARQQWISALETLFLKPTQLSLQSPPPNFQPLITGFCSVCDWLGSKTDDFSYQTNIEDLTTYFNKRLAIAYQVIQNSGLINQAKPYSSIHALLNANTPRQLQTLVDNLPDKTGLTIIEAPTGSGKTEAALAYAWRLLDKQLADSIIFALPTQATSNAMFERLENMAKVLFGTANIVLAHGKARFNKAFWQLQQRGNSTTAQENEEANVQCAEWLAGSRKRVFLGQIGVCTVDQVLVSVLPIRHKSSPHPWG
jgi:CRISPR-associated endonuclease/helicase Cas3